MEEKSIEAFFIFIHLVASTIGFESIEHALNIPAIEY